MKFHKVWWFSIIIEDKSFPKTDYLLINNLFEEQIKELVGILKSDEVDILNKLYGMNGELPQTLNEVGKGLNLSREAIRQKRNILLKRLKIKIKELNLTF